MKAIVALALCFLVACAQVEDVQNEQKQEVSQTVMQQEVTSVKNTGGMGVIILAAIPVSRTQDNVRVRMKLSGVTLQHENGMLLLTNGSFELPQGNEKEPVFLFETKVPIGRYDKISFSFDKTLIDVSGNAAPAITSGNAINAPLQIVVNEAGKTLIVIELDSSASVFTTIKQQKVLLPVFNFRSSESVNARVAESLQILSEHVLEERRYGLDLSGKTQSGVPIGKNTLLNVIEGSIVIATASPEKKALVRKLKNIRIAGREFDPPELIIEAGSTVMWNNAGTADHHVVFETGQQSETIKGGTSYSKTFDTQGTYKYECGIHENMKGKIMVI